MKRRTAVLLSGRGSNFRSLLAATQAPGFPAEIVLVLSNVPDAGGLVHAVANGIATAAIDHRAYRGNRAAHEAALIAAMEAAGVELVCLAGYMRKLTPLLVGRYAGRMLNIHPSLLPSFPGLHTHERALTAGVKLHGCTVHLVTDGLDEGPIVAQAAVPVLPGDTPDTLAARVLVQEHLIYPAALAQLALGGSGVTPPPGAALHNPLPVSGPLP